MWLFQNYSLQAIYLQTAHHFSIVKGFDGGRPSAPAGPVTASVVPGWKSAMVFFKFNALAQGKSTENYRKPWVSLMGFFWEKGTPNFHDISPHVPLNWPSYGRKNVQGPSLHPKSQPGEMIQPLKPNNQRTNGWVLRENLQETIDLSMKYGALLFP